ncbi:kinase-like domain-containing protein [Scenedesmus sp. NREL 46B-D3]|nr:kinase-like domain-containing protein [Scenedesmus sp. NREL 46B-D3]
MHEDDFAGKEPTLQDSGQGYIGRRAISQQVTLGVLLGAGSFGRVYKGRWHSSDVAVKIMSCTRADLAKVLKEAEVMMQLNHHNIVRAFHASVWNPAEQARALQAREARGSSTVGASKKAPQNRASSKLSAAIGSALKQQPHTSTAASSIASGHLLDGSYGNGGGVNTATTSANSLVVAAGPSATAAAAAAPPPAPASAALANGQGGSLELTASPAGRPWANVTQAGDAAAPAAPGSTARSVHDTAHQWEQPSAAAAGASSAGSGSSTAAGGQQQQQQHIDSSAASGSSHPSAVAEAREQSSPLAAAADTSAAQAAAAVAAAAEGGRSQQHLLGKFGKSSGSSTPVPGSDGTAAAAAANGSSNASAAAAAGPAVFSGLHASHGSEQQQRAEAGSSGRSSEKRRRWQEREQKHVSRELATATTATTDTQSEEHAEEPQRAEVQVWLVLELCAGGTLKDAVTSGRLRLENNIGLVKLLSRLLDTARGMAYLHSKGVMHGDLKAGNVLLHNVHGTFDQVAKISDFGLAAVLLDGATHRSTASMGTITHMAPEVLRSGHLSPAADVYSFAIMMWEVFCNRQAYQGLHYGAVVERVVIQKQRPPIPDDMPDEYSLLMSSCWDAEPNNRPSFSQIATCLELMIDNLTNEAGRLDDADGDMVQGSGIAAAAMEAAAPAGFAAAGGGGSSDQVAAVGSGASTLAGGAGGSTGGSDASGWRQQLQLQQQRVVYPVPAAPLVGFAGSAHTSSHSDHPAVGMLTPTQRQQQRQRMQVDQGAAGQDRGSGGRPAAAGAAAAAAGGGAAGHVTPHSAHSTGSQVFASGANVLDSNQFLQDL